MADDEDYEDADGVADDEEIEETKPVRPAKSAKPVKTTSAATAQPWANPQVRVAGVIILVIAIGLGLWLGGVFKSSKPKLVNSIGPYVFNEAALRTEAGKLGTPFYWAGPKPGMAYEFTRNTHGTLFVRYVTPGTTPGETGKKVKNDLIIVTYPVTKQGYLGLLRQAKAKGAVKHGPNGSIIYPDAADRRNVYVAFPNNPLAQVVVFDNQKGVAMRAASHVVVVTG